MRYILLPFIFLCMMGCAETESPVAPVELEQPFNEIIAEGLAGKSVYAIREGYHLFREPYDHVEVFDFEPLDIESDWWDLKVRYRKMVPDSFDSVMVTLSHYNIFVNTTYDVTGYVKFNNPTSVTFWINDGWYYYYGLNHRSEMATIEHGFIMNYTDYRFVGHILFLGNHESGRPYYVVDPEFIEELMHDE